MLNSSVCWLNQLNPNFSWFKHVETCWNHHFLLVKLHSGLVQLPCLNWGLAPHHQDVRRYNRHLSSPNYVRIPQWHPMHLLHILYMYNTMHLGWYNQFSDTDVRCIIIIIIIYIYIIYVFGYTQVTWNYWYRLEWYTSLHIYTLYMYGNVLLTPWSSPRMLGALGLTKPPEDSASCWGFSWVRVSEMYQEKHNIGFCTAKNTPVLCWWRHQIFFFVSHFLLRIQLYIYICKSSTGIGMIPCAVCWTAHIH